MRSHEATAVRRGAAAALACALACGEPGRPGDAYDPTTTVGATTSETSGGGGSSTDADGSSGETSMSTTATTSPPTTTVDPTGLDSSTSDATTADATTTGGIGDVCDGVDGRLIPPTRCDGPSGNTSTEVPSNGLFSTSWFGCYYGDDGEIVQDPSDNCEFACGPQGLCDASEDGPTCEANLQWFAADADRFGCGGRVRVTNCENGNQVVLVTLDRGPNCGVEMDCGTPVLDMSHDAMVYLFDGGIFGGCDQQVVVVEQVDDATPLGPV